MRFLFLIAIAIALMSCSTAQAQCPSGVCPRPAIRLFHRPARVLERSETVEQTTTTTTHAESHAVHRGCRAGRWFPGRGVLRGTRAVVRGTARVASAPLRMGRHRGCR